MTTSTTTQLASFLPVDPAWDEALLRVESYLRAHGLESRVLVSALAADILAEARARALAGGAEPPVTVAMQVTQARIGEWLSRLGPPGEESSGQPRAHGRVALIVADLPGRWANYFLSAEPAPPDLAAALASFRLVPGPELLLSRMAPAAIEFGSGESDDPNRLARRIWVPARAVVSWALIVGFFSIAWAASH